MHGGLQSLFGGGNSDQLKTLYTNLGSANNQVQLKYITGQGLLSPLIIRASDLGLAPDQDQAQILPEFLNEFNNLNPPGQFMVRPGKHSGGGQLFQRPDLFGDMDAGLMKMKRKRKRKKQPIFKFPTEHDSMEFNKPNSMEFNRHNSMEFPSSMNDHNSRPRVKKQRNSFEKSYDDLVNSAKKLADTIENSSDNDDINIESEGKEKKTPTAANFGESDKFNFDDEMKLSPKDEDELDNLEKLENLSGFGGGTSTGGGGGGSKKNMNVDSFRDDFDSIEKSLEKNTFGTSSTDNDKFSDLFANEKFSDLFSEKIKENDKYDENDDDDKSYDKLYDKIISKINSGGKDKKSGGDKYGMFNEHLFEENQQSKKKNKKSTKKKKPEPTPDPNAETDDADEATSGNKDPEGQDDLKANAENEPTEYNTNNNSGHTETGEYDYAGYAKDPNEQSEEINENPEPDKAPDKGSDKGQQSDGKYQEENAGSPGSDGGKYTDSKYQDVKYQDSKYQDGKYQNQHQNDQPTGSPPSDNREPENYNRENYNSNYKEQPTQSGDDERNSGNGERSFQPFTRLSVRKQNVRNPTNRMPGDAALNRFSLKDKPSNKLSTSNNKLLTNSNQFNDGRTTKVVRVRSKRVRGASTGPNLIRF